MKTQRNIAAVLSAHYKILLPTKTIPFHFLISPFVRAANCANRTLPQKLKRKTLLTFFEIKHIASTFQNVSLWFHL